MGWRGVHLPGPHQPALPDAQHEDLQTVRHVNILLQGYAAFGMPMFMLVTTFTEGFLKRDLNSVLRCGLQSSSQQGFSNMSLALTAGSSVEACLQQYLQVRSSR